MKKIFIFIVLLCAIALFLFIQIKKEKASVYNQENFYIEDSFSFSLPENYFVQEQESDLIPERYFVLSEIYESLNETEVVSEAPPSISILVFKNEEKLNTLDWVEQNNQFTNINLKMGEMDNYTIDGQEGVRYMADGLYVSDNLVFSYKEKIYLISGSYLDENSKIRQDFLNIISSIKFI